MSIALFINTDRTISQFDTKKVAEILTKNNVFDVELHRFECIENGKGEYYFLDSMWVPFLKELQSFKGKTKQFHKMQSLIRAMQEIIGLLFSKKYEIKIFHQSVETKNFSFQRSEKLRLQNLQEAQLNWDTVYEIIE